MSALSRVCWKLTNSSRHRFRWVACQLDALSGCRSLNKLRQTLDSLPTTLDGTYDRILCNIDPMFKRETLQILQWLASSLRPLTVEEVAELVAFDVDGEPKFDAANRLADVEEILDLCSSLTICTMPDSAESDDTNRDLEGSTTISEAGGPIIRLAHFSVKEYLLSSRIRQGPAAFFSVDEQASHLRIAQTCLSCLLLYEDGQSTDTKAFATEYPIADYAAEHWLSHFWKAQDILKERHYDCASKLILDKQKLRNWVNLLDIDNYAWQYYIIILPGRGSSLYYAVLTGLYCLVEVVLCKINKEAREKRPDSRRFESMTYNNDWVPTSHSHDTAYIDQIGGTLWTPLTAATWYGTLDIVKLLLDHGANPNTYGQASRNYFFCFDEARSALSAAVYHGRVKIAKLLLDHGADIHEGVPCALLARSHAIDF